MRTAAVGAQAGSHPGPGPSPANPDCCFRLPSSHEPGEPNRCHHGTTGQDMHFAGVPMAGARPADPALCQQRGGANPDPPPWPQFISKPWEGAVLLQGYSTGDITAGASTSLTCRAVGPVWGRMEQPPGALGRGLTPPPRGSIPPPPPPLLQRLQIGNCIGTQKAAGGETG